ncbi:hypothetical protein EDC01DRAFT_294278 [Geopyxis carbonaria]|nr:hypothetical protein EDC01DRAFT_294278 [Geopyxis carbonaria]
MPNNVRPTDGETIEMDADARSRRVSQLPAAARQPDRRRHTHLPSSLLLRHRGSSDDARGGGYSTLAGGGAAQIVGGVRQLAAGDQGTVSSVFSLRRRWDCLLGGGTFGFAVLCETATAQRVRHSTLTLHDLRMSTPLSAHAAHGIAAPTVAGALRAIAPSGPRRPQLMWTGCRGRSISGPTQTAEDLNRRPRLTKHGGCDAAAHARNGVPKSLVPLAT